ncbi:GLOBIN domain-containing protein [Durusdinium trenchii]|uniref:GLOBIN domain-containing protein n=1 Tax=Durusdinium trenchii TaxID=1381693 RepID=A0ABP0S3F7_9DINO
MMEDDEASEEIHDEVPREDLAEAPGEVDEEGPIPTDINTETLERLELPSDVAEATQQAWRDYLNTHPSNISAGEAIYSSIFDANPGLQAAFKSPKASVAERFVNGLSDATRLAGSKGKLLSLVQILGFRHLDIEVSPQKVDLFRDALLEMLELEMGKRFPPKAQYGFALLLNYVGGAFIFIRREYQSRVQLIHSTWHAAKEGIREATAVTTAATDQSRRSSKHKDEKETVVNDISPVSREAEAQPSKFDNVVDEMFHFNVSAMGYSAKKHWMDLVLEQLDEIVINVSQSCRIREECEKLALVLAKYEGQVVISEVRSVVMSSLKSFISTWGEEHEVAWAWFWINVEKLIAELDGKLRAQERHLEDFLQTSSKEAVDHVVQNMHNKFFEIAPAGQEFFKVSKTRMYHIAERTLDLALALHRDPKQTVRDLSALGLRHVALSIPVEFFPPFVQGAVEALEEATEDEMVIRAFRWSVALLGKILTRTVIEGSNLVMCAINMNDEKAVKKAVAISPRGTRAESLLYVTVGTDSVSPLLWAIDCGSLVAAKAILKDLLTIRADRHSYYYGCDELFARHPHIIDHLIHTASSLLPTLLDGLIWRSRYAVEGKRRVNYYVKHLIEDSEGKFNQALKWIVQSRDTELVRHPALELVCDTIWERLALRLFLIDQSIYLIFLIVFVTGQSFLQHLNSGDPDAAVRTVTFICRLIIYLGSIPQLLLWHLRKIRANRREGHVVNVGVQCPVYLQSTQALYKLGLLLCLILMCILEPTFWCVSEMQGSYSGAGLFTQSCPTARPFRDIYSLLSMLAALFYWLILSNLSILSMRALAFCLLCGQLFGEFCLFMIALAFLILTFASSLSALEHESWAFSNIARAALSLWELSLGMASKAQLESLGDDLILFLALAAFATALLIFFLSLLVAQFDQAYEIRYEEMLGFARLKRCECVVLLLETVSLKSWTNFRESLQLEVPLEFNAGDVGIAGGLQVSEPAVKHPTARESIKRYAGSSSQSMPWPEEKLEHDEDPFDQLERDTGHSCSKFFHVVFFHLFSDIVYCAPSCLCKCNGYPVIISYSFLFV